MPVPGPDGKLPFEIAKDVIKRETPPPADMETMVKRGALALAALLMFCVVVTKVMSPAKNGDINKVFAERTEPIPDPNRRPARSGMFSWFTNDAPAEKPLSVSNAASAVAPKDGGSAAWRAAVAAAKKDTAVPFSPPKLGAGPSLGGGGSGGSSSASATFGQRNDGLFHGQGTGMVVGNLKTAGARTGMKPGGAASPEALKSFGSRQSDALQLTHTGDVALGPASTPQGGGGPGEKKEDKGTGPTPTTDDKATPPMPDHKPSGGDGPKPGGGAPPGGGGGAGQKPGQNCQALAGINTPAPANATTSNPGRSASGKSLCGANSELAQHNTLKNGSGDQGDSQACASSCPAGTGTGTGPASTQGDGKGYDQTLKDARQKVKETATKTGQECVEKNNDAVGALRNLERFSTTRALDQGAAKDIPTPDEFGQILDRQLAEAAARPWDPGINKANSTRTASAKKCAELASSDTTKPIDDLYAKAEDLLKKDRAHLERAAGLKNVSPWDLTAVQDATNVIYNRYSQEFRTAQKKFADERKLWTDFKTALTSGAIKQYDTAVGDYVTNGVQSVNSAKSGINLAKPGMAGTFTSASSEVATQMDKLRNVPQGLDGARNAVSTASQ